MKKFIQLIRNQRITLEFALSILFMYCFAPSFAAELGDQKSMRNPRESLQQKLSIEQRNQLYGVYEPSDRLGESLFGYIRIDDNKISWGGKISSPECEAFYAIQEIGKGETFPDRIIFGVHDQGEQYWFVKLEIIQSKKNCSMRLSGFLFAFSIPSNTGAAVISYEKKGHPGARMNFQKIDHQ